MGQKDKEATKDRKPAQISLGLAYAESNSTLWDFSFFCKGQCSEDRKGRKAAFSMDLFSLDIWLFFFPDVPFDHLDQRWDNYN